MEFEADAHSNSKTPSRAYTQVTLETCSGTVGVGVGVGEINCGAIASKSKSAA